MPGATTSRENVYTCPVCGGYTVTVDIDEGTTPALLNCRASGREGDCPGMAVSAFYPVGQRPSHIPAPAWEWYKPSAKEARRADKKWPGMLQHAQMGGLFLRKRAAEK